MPFKIAVIGPKASGKSALLDRLINQKFNYIYAPTFGSQLRCHWLNIKAGRETEESIQLQFWDTSSQPHFQSINSMYCRSADAILLICDLTQTVESPVEQCAAKQLTNLSPDAPPLIILVGTKLDQVHDHIAAEQRLQKLKEQLLAEHHLSCNYVLTSACTGSDVQELGSLIADELYQPHGIKPPEQHFLPEHDGAGSLQQRPQPKLTRREKIWQAIKTHPWRYSFGLLLAIGVILLITLPIVAQTLGAASLINWLLINTAIQLGTSLFITKIIASIGLGALAFFAPTLTAYMLRYLSHTLKSISTMLGNSGEYFSNAAYHFKNKLWRGLLFTAAFLTYLCARLIYAVSYIVKHTSLSCLGRSKDKQQPQANALVHGPVDIKSYSHTAGKPSSTDESFTLTDSKANDHQRVFYSFPSNPLTD